jgi:hypothetical protein
MLGSSLFRSLEAGRTSRQQPITAAQRCEPACTLSRPARGCIRIHPVHSPSHRPGLVSLSRLPPSCALVVEANLACSSRRRHVEATAATDTGRHHGAGTDAEADQRTCQSAAGTHAAQRSCSMLREQLVEYEWHSGRTRAHAPSKQGADDPRQCICAAFVRIGCSTACLTALVLPALSCLRSASSPRSSASRSASSCSPVPA